MHVSFLKRKSLHENEARMAKIVKKITRLNFQNLVFLLAKYRCFVIIAFKVLEMEFKFEYTILIIDYISATHVRHLISVKVKKISGAISGSISREVKRIEVQAKWWFSYKKRVLFLAEVQCKVG